MSRTRLVLGAVIIVVGISAAMVYERLAMRASPDVTSIVACVRASDTLECARPIIKQLLEHYRASDLIAAIAQHDLPESQCHFFTHIIGQETYLKYRNTERALSECELGCGEGCLHGVVGETFITEAGLSEDQVDPDHLSAADVTNIGASLCNTANTCHGIGHAIFYSAHSFPSALAICTNVGTTTIARASCYSGVFMEYSTEIRSESMWKGGDRAFATPTRDALASFCDQFPLAELRSCYYYLPFIVYAARETSEPTVSRTAITAEVWNVCMQKHDEEARRACVFGMGAYQYVAARLNPAGVRAFCAQLPTTADRASCVYGVVTLDLSFAPPSRMLAFCTGIAEDAVRAFCYQVVFAQAPAVPETHESSASLRAACRWWDAACVRASSASLGYGWDILTAAFPLQRDPRAFEKAVIDPTIHEALDFPQGDVHM